MKINNLKKGISLVEIIIYIAIFSIFVISLSTFTKTLTSTRINNQNMLEVNDQGAYLIEYITQTIRNADTVNGPIVANSGVTLNLGVSDVNANPTVFSENSGVLSVTEGGGNSVELTNNKVTISNLLFTNLSQPVGPNVVQIRFTLTSVGSSNYSKNFYGSATLRK